MKRKMIVLAAALLLLVSVVIPASEARAAMKDAYGSCFLTPSGKSVTFGGKTSSANVEDTIEVSATLWELRNGAWYAIASVSKSEQNSKSAKASKTVTVSGGYYYKVTAHHFAQTGSTSSSSNTHTSNTWIPN